MDLIRRMFAPERRAATLSALELIAQQRGYSSHAGVTVNAHTALQHMTVWSCVTLIADAIAMLTRSAHTTDTAGIPEAATTPQVVRDPYEEGTAFDWHVAMLWAVLMRGDAYARVVGRGRGAMPEQLQPVHPSEVRHERDRDTGVLFYEVGKDRERVEQHDMMHVRGLVVPGSTYGLDPISYARHTIGTGLAAVEYGGRFFEEGAVPPGVLTSEQKMDTDTALEYQARWEQAHGHRQRKVAVLGGGLSYEAVQLSPANTQFLETIDATKADIAGFFRCPPHLVGDVERSTSWGTGIEEQGIQFVTFTCGPWLSRFEHAWMRILRPSGLEVAYGGAELMRGRAVDRAQFYRTMREISAMNADDVRAAEGWAPLPDGMGEDYLMPLNYAPIPPGGGPAMPPPPAPKPDAVTDGGT